MNRSSSGFTLIELMITIFIAALLAALAVSSYRDHMHRTRIAEATGQLAILSMRLEQFYQDNRTYGDTTDCGINLPVMENFSYTCATSNNGTSYLLTATGRTERGTQDFTFTLNQAGTQRTLRFPIDWGTAPVNCWIMRRGMECPS